MKTPETDSVYKFWPCEQEELVRADFARKLEIERDAARAELAEWKKLQMWGETPEHVHDFIRARIIKGQKMIRKVATQRDKYKKQLA
jgi:hypothetical protein